jgi:hypothetical protein
MIHIFWNFLNKKVFHNLRFIFYVSYFMFYNDKGVFLPH